MKIQNAIITKATITNVDHGCLTLWLELDYGTTGQSFGGYNLYNEKTKDNAGVFIWEILKITDCVNWENIVGKVIRVKSDNERIEEIGHIIKDIWFNPKAKLLF